MCPEIGHQCHDSVTLVGSWCMLPNNVATTSEAGLKRISGGAYASFVNCVCVGSAVPLDPRDFGLHHPSANLTEAVAQNHDEVSK